MTPILLETFDVTSFDEVNEPLIDLKFIDGQASRLYITRYYSLLSNEKRIQITEDLFRALNKRVLKTQLKVQLIHSSDMTSKPSHSLFAKPTAWSMNASITGIRYFLELHNNIVLRINSKVYDLLCQDSHLDLCVEMYFVET